VVTRRYAETVKVVPSPAERVLYEEISARVRATGRAASPHERLMLKTLQKLAGSSPAAVLPALQRLDWRGLAALAHQAAVEDLTGKERALLSLLHATRDKVIVFASYTETLNMLERLLTAAGHAVVTYAGTMTRAQKDAAVRRFAREARVFLSTEAGGEGRNLQFCNRMINYDLPWNPMRIEQRLGRIHRVGQTRDVYVHTLCTAGSLEEQLLELLDHKLSLFELVVGEIDLILGDVLEERDFEEMVFDMWLASSDAREFGALLDKLGEAMAEAKRRYVHARHLQDAVLLAAT
ncbi:MAG TPA: SWF/SNF helicase family protein, partial [Firmicutes bacterium]|nr:SWF/SNF helicase family protein [Bacillota bacterium]